MLRIFTFIFLFFFVYVLSVVVLNLLPTNTPTNTNETPYIDIPLNPEASPSATEQIDLDPSL